MVDAAAEGTLLPRQGWQQKWQKVRTRWTTGQSTGPTRAGSPTATSRDTRFILSVSSWRTEQGTKRSLERTSLEQRAYAAATTLEEKVQRRRKLVNNPTSEVLYQQV